MTLSQLISKWRGILKDVNYPQLWSDEDLAFYANDTIDELTEELYLIEDSGTQTLSASISFTATTKTITRAAGSFIADGYKVGMPIITTSTNNPAFTIATVSALTMTVEETVVDEVAGTDSIYDAVCHIKILADGTFLYSINDRIIRISRAKLANEGSPLQILRTDCVATMDATYLGWESAAVSTPHTILTEGVGTSKIRIYPPAKTADILKLIVFRNQLVPLNVSEPDASPEIPEKFHKYLDNGVYKRCYSIDDQEILKAGLAEKYRGLFEKDKDDIRKKLIKRNYSDQTATPPLGVL